MAPLGCGVIRGGAASRCFPPAAARNHRSSLFTPPQRSDLRVNRAGSRRLGGFNARPGSPPPARAGLESSGVAMQVRSLAVPVEDHDHLRRPIESLEGMGRHRRELGRLAGLHHDRPLAEHEADASLEHVEPVVAGVHTRFRGVLRGFDPHLHRGRRARRTVQRPRRHARPTRRNRPDDDVVAVDVPFEQGLEVDLERPRQRHQDVETDRPLTGLDPTDRRRAEAAALRQGIEGPPQGPAQASQPHPDQPVNVGVLLLSVHDPHAGLAHFARCIVESAS